MFVVPRFLGSEFGFFFQPVARGREPIAVNQPGGGGTVYPFIYESDVNHIIADAYVYSVGDGCNFAQPFSIKWLYGFGTLPTYSPAGVTHTQDTMIVDANGQVVFDSREASVFNVKPWGDRLEILEWQLSDPERVLRLVRFLAVAEDEEPTNFPKYYEPTYSDLDSRTIEFIRPRVRSLNIGVHELQEKLRLINGYNVEMTVEEFPAEVGGRNSTVVTLDAIPGAGKGRYSPGCNEEPLLRMLNGVRPDERGNITLEGTDCYRIERPILAALSRTSNAVAIIDHTLQILNDCLPCCDCQQYINTYEAIRKLRNTYADLNVRIKNIRDIHVENIARWNAQRDCRLRQSLQVAIQPSCTNDVQFAVGFCNHDDECVENLVVILSYVYSDEAGDLDVDGNPLAANTIFSGENDPAIACGSSRRAGNFDANSSRGFSRNQPVPYSISGTYPHFYAMWDRVSPGGLAALTFKLGFPGGEPSDLVELVIDAYSVPSDLTSPVGSASPVPGYEFGAGPLTDEAKSYRVGRPIKVSSGLLQSDCCE